MLTITPKINDNTNNLNPLKSSFQPSFGSVLPQKEIFQHTEMLVQEVKDVFEPQKIEQISEKYIGKIKLLILHNASNLSFNEKNIIRSFQDDWVNKIVNKHRWTIKKEQNVINQKDAIKQFAENIKECTEKWMKVEDYVNNPNKEVSAPDGFDSFKANSGIF